MSIPVIAKSGLHKCDSCDFMATHDLLRMIDALADRVDAGGIVPSGQCPECGALCYPVEKADEDELRLDIRMGFVHRFGKLVGHMDEDAASDLLNHVVGVVLTDGQLKALVEQLEADEEQMNGEIPPGASFSTTCPYCDQEDLLSVQEVTMMATGSRHHPKSRLGKYGFDVDPAGTLDEAIYHDQSTEDEIVLCLECGKKFDLSEVTL